MTQPEKIGRYRIISELGRGGMATVFAATDPSFERQVAIKVLPRAFLHDPQFRARFEREAKTVAALEHAAIVPVYDFGEEDGQPFIVMRLMAGGSLADTLQEGKFTLEHAARIIIRLAPALDAAHKKGIIHRDLKPGNILFDQYENAFLSDFGIARLTEAGATLTGGNILGTPAYMSPEQVQGDKDLDGRSDLYSLGVIFYQMLIGHTPYQATTPAKVMMMHILEPVPDLITIMPDIPPAVKTWLEKCLAKDPDQRFLNAIDMAAALETALRGEIHPTLQGVSPVGSMTVQAAPATVMSASGASGGGAQPIARPLVPAALPKKKKSSLIPITLGVLGLAGLGLIAVIALVLMGIAGNGPLAMLASASATPTSAPATATLAVEPDPTETLAAINDPTATPEPAPIPTETEMAVVVVDPPTATFEPSPTPEPIPDRPVIGGADLIAFIRDNDIWTMNVDGSALRQVTTDRGAKTNLSWTPDGSTLIYISGKCIWGYELESDSLDFLACFDSAEYLDAFSVSPDGSQVAISLNRELYIVPFDREALAQARNHNNLNEMSQCEAVSPFTYSNGSIVPTKLVRWSKDGNTLAITVLIPSDGKLADAVRLIDVSDCNQYPIRLDEIPAARFTIEGYANTPYIQNFGYNGVDLITLVSYKRNDGYGDLYIYNTVTRKADVKVNPLNGACCYRDFEFSPDGSYLLFVYQAFEPGATAEIYLVRYATLGTGAVLEPIELPEGFFSNIKERPQPVLRPTQ